MKYFDVGGTVTDLDGDGLLEVILSHGESAEQPLTVYKLRSTEVCATPTK